MTETQEKRLYALVLILVIAVSLLGGFALYMSYRPPVVAPQAPGSESKTISVSGVGTVPASPDMGWFTATAVTRAGTAADAEQLNNKAMSSVISALKNAGIADKDIQTVDYSLQPIYQEAKETGQTPILVGYSVTNSVRVTVNDLPSVGKMIDLAISNGANDVSGVYFGLSNAKEQQAQTQALDLAVKDANDKAKTIADSMGVKLVGPVSVSLGYSYTPVSATLREAGAQAPVPIQPGQLEYTVNVQIAYAFS
jgi:uncharacterized protein YggE